MTDPDRLDVIADAERALRGATDPESLWQRGNALITMHSFRADPALLDDAVAALGCGYAVTKDAPRHQAAFAASLADALLAQYADDPRRRECLDDAVRLAAEAAALDPHDLGFAHQDVYVRWRLFSVDGGREILEGIIAEARQLLPQTVGRPDQAGWTWNLAKYLRARATNWGDDPASLAAAVDAYRDACRIAIDSPDMRSASGLEAALEWASWAGERAAWEEAEEATTFGELLLHMLVEAQTSRSAKLGWLWRGRGLHVVGARALAELGRPGEAAERLERGRAVLLTRSFEDSRTERLRAVGRADLAQRLRLAERGALREIGERREAALRVQSRVIEEIRSIAGLEDFPIEEPADVLDVASSDTPLVYLAPTPEGTLTLTVRHGTVTAGFLEDLSWHAEPVRDYFAAYMGRASRRTPASEAEFDRSLEAATGWLWEAGLGTLASLPGDHLTLVPGGPLTFLPLHAAWTADVTRPTGRRHLGDDLVVSVAPSARAIRESLGRSRPSFSARGAAITAPIGEAPSAAIQEAALVASAFGSQVLSGVSPATALAALADSDIVHFAGHGHADQTDPLASSVTIGADTELTAREILDHRVSASVVMLSACESGVPGARAIDEVIGMPSALVQAGAKGVIASLWPVPDSATLEIAFGVYRQLRQTPDAHPGNVLREAQRFVRDTPREAKLATYSDLEDWVPESAAKTLRRSAAIAGTARLSDWAAFTYIGT